jgi:hypothetical protein
MQSASDKLKTKVVKEENDNNNNKPKIKESMKRLKFNKDGDKPFKGVNLTQKLGHALSLIPEHFRIDNKEFEMTDGNLSLKVRWEGTLNEGKGVVLTAKDATSINEDMDRMKALMGYKSQETLGLVKGKARLDENKIFGDIWNKSKKLLDEAEDIEDADVIDGSAESLDDAVSYAPEAKKHIEGSASTDDGTDVPAPKKGEWEKINVPQAADAKKHIEGSVAEDKKTNAPAPKEGNWEEIKKKSADASKDVESGKPTNMATDKAKTVAPAKAVNENEEEAETEEEPQADAWEKPSDDDNSPEENEPTAKDIKGEVPSLAPTDDDDTAQIPAAPKMSATILFSPSTGAYWLKKGDASTKVPDEFLAIASDKTKKGSERAAIILKAMQEKADSGVEAGNEEGELAENMNSDETGNGDDDMNTGK